MKDLVPLTYNYSTAMSAHLVLEQVIEIQCMLAKSTDYGLKVTDSSLIRVANTLNTQFLLQSELRAIHKGLKYKEIEVNECFTYKGYVDKDGKWEGLGIRIWSNGDKDYSEWHLNNIHGCGKLEWANGNSYWGEFKDGNWEGFATLEECSGKRYIG